MNFSSIGKDINKAKSILERNGLVAIPTETVYGLAANALNPKAVEKIFLAKNRPNFNPLIIHLSNFETIEKYVQNIPENAKKLAEAFSPGPITFLFMKKSTVPNIVTAGKDTVAVRIPNHPLTLELLSQLNFPLAAPSANPFGYISPTSAQHVENQLSGKVDYILDGGNCSVGLESTIIDFTSEEPIILRLGGLSVEAIESVVGKLEVQINIEKNPSVPGQLKSHYAPKKTLIIGEIEDLIVKYSGKSIGILSFDRFYPEIIEENQVILSKSGDLEEAAQNLFTGLRFLDEKEIDLILTEKFPEEGLGRAINDRISRAAVEQKK